MASRRRAGSSSRSRRGSSIETREPHQSTSPSTVAGGVATSSTSPPPSNDTAPAWARHLLAQVEDLRAAARSSSHAEPGEASDTDTEFARQAHEDQYKFNKKMGSLFKGIVKDPSRARQLAEKGEALIAERQKILRIADVDGWDTVRIFSQKPLVDSESEKRRLKEAREQALARRRSTNTARPRQGRREEIFRSPSPQERRKRSRSRSPSQGRWEKRSWRNERQFPSTRVARDDRDGHPRCFECGDHGHFRASCPRLRRGDRRMQPGAQEPHNAE